MRYPSNKNQQLTLMVLICLCSVCFCDQFYFRKTLVCLNENTTSQCQKWNDTTSMSYYSIFGTYCFPGDAYVQTSNGPIQLQHLVVGDQIFGINSLSGKSQYSEVSGWLHRDTLGIIKYQQIQTTENDTFLASEYHNIAFYTDSGEIDFKFTHQLAVGDQLVSFGSKNAVKILSIGQSIQKKGLYSPLTRFSNFYIYPKQFVPQNNTQQGNQANGDQVDKANGNEMILVHCLSQIKDPLQKEKLVQNYINWSGYLGMNSQPSKQIYSNGLISHFSFVFGRDWVSHESLIRYQHDYSYSSSSAQQQQQQLSYKALTVGTLMMVQELLY